MLYYDALVSNRINRTKSDDFAADPCKKHDVVVVVRHPDAIISKRRAIVNETTILLMRSSSNPY